MILCRFRFFDDYITHFRVIFEIFSKYNISIELIKMFLKYFNVTFLEQKINPLSLSTIEERLKVLSMIKFSTTIKNLKYYLKLTKHIRNQIHHYSTIVKFLQNLKINFLKISSNSEQKRNQFTSKINILFTLKKKAVVEDYAKRIKQSHYTLSFCRFEHVMNKS